MRINKLIKALSILLFCSSIGLSLAILFTSAYTDENKNLFCSVLFADLFVTSSLSSLDMLARVLKPNATTIAKCALTTNNIRMMDSRRYKSYGSEVQHGSNDHAEVDHHGHHDPYKTIYERLWQHKATLDWLPKPEGNWQEIEGKKQAYYNKLLIGGLAAFALSLVYLRAVIVTKAGALTQPPYHLIGNEDFPGSKYDDVTGGKEQ